MEQIGHHVIYSATSHGHHPGVLLAVSHGLSTLLESYILKTIGRNTTQPGLENRINKQVSAWTLKFVFSKQHRPICAWPCI